jgi:phosphonoacetaldehyde hydrolase
MGRDKRDHLRALLGLPSVSAQWRSRHGRDWDGADLERLYEDYLPLQRAAVEQNADLVPGTLATVNALRRRGVLVAVTTGYDRDLAGIALARAERQGFVPDAVCTASDVPVGRPAPYMILRVMSQLGVTAIPSVLAVGDTVADVQAGRNAGVWTAGVVRSGNLVGLSAAEVDALPAPERIARWRRAADLLRAAGAHFTLDTFADVTQTVHAIAQPEARAIA